MCTLFVSNVIKKKHVSIRFIQLKAHGGWSYWGNWTTCTTTCGNGTQTMSRTCNKPTPSVGGMSCQGQTNHTRTCKIKTCPGESSLII